MILMNGSTLPIVWQSKNSVFKLHPPLHHLILCPDFFLFLQNGIPVLSASAYVEGVSIFDGLFALF